MQTLSLRRVSGVRLPMATLCFILALTSCARESGGNGNVTSSSAPLTGQSAPAQQDAANTPSPFRAVVDHVDDGDTFSVRSGSRVFRVRLSGVDAPEIGQRFGVESRNRLRTLIFDRTIEVHAVGVDQYGRLLACPTADGQNVCETMVAEGWAWHYRQYSSDAWLATLEKQAREARRGLWTDPNARPPWELRAEERSRSGGGAAGGAPVGAASGGAGRGTAAAAGPFHGNVKSLVYHAAGCPDYNCTNCTAVFVTREAAEANGYRPHRECVR